MVDDPAARAGQDALGRAPFPDRRCVAAGGFGQPGGPVAPVVVAGCVSHDDAEVVLGLGHHAFGVNEAEGPVVSLARVQLMQAAMTEDGTRLVVGEGATIRAGDRICKHPYRACRSQPRTFFREVARAMTSATGTVANDLIASWTSSTGLPILPGTASSSSGVGMGRVTQQQRANVDETAGGSSSHRSRCHRYALFTVLLGLLASLLPALVSPIASAQTTTDVEAPSQPTSPRWADTTTGSLTISIAAEDGRARAAWAASNDAASGIASYSVQVDTDPDFAAPFLERSVAGTTRYLILGPADGLRYGGAFYFRVAAVDGAGNQSTWSAASNRLLVTDQTTGPAIIHAPITSAYVGQPIPIQATATCEGPERSCTGRLYWRETPITGAQAAFDGIGDRGWQITDLDRGALTTIDANRDAVEWSAEIPAAAVTTAGVDYYLEFEDTAAQSTFPGGVFVGSRYATGVQPAAHAFQHIHVISPPVLGHLPPPFARDGESVPIQLDATCSTASCTATLYYRSTDGSVLAEDLLATPDWPRVGMEITGSPTDLGDAGMAMTFAAEIPADAVDTRGVDYFMHVSDGVTEAWSPGTTYQGYYAPTDGMRTAWYHLHVLEPPHVVHEPVLAGPYRAAIPIQAQANCTSGACAAQLYFRTTTSNIITAESFDSAPMTVTTVGTVDGVDLIQLEGVIPGSDTDTRGVDYFFSVTDGATTSWWPGTSHIDGFVPIEGTRVGYHHVRVTDPPHFVHVPAVTTPALRDLTIETELTCVEIECEVALSYTQRPTSVRASVDCEQESCEIDLTDPAAFTTIPMTRITEPTPTPAGFVARWKATVPAEHVVTTGLGYFMHANDGYVNAYQPGSSYSGAYVPVDGARAGMHVVRVLEPPHVVHVPVAAHYYDQDIAIDATSNCATGTCTATLHWRTSGHPWRNAAMAISAGGPATPAGDTITTSGTIPADDVTTEGVDYWIEVNDGYVTDRTATYHTTVLAPTSILHAPVTTARPDAPIPVEAVVPCSTPTCTVELYWRVTGDSLLDEPEWNRALMSATGSGVAILDATTATTHRATIPGDAVTTKGIEYFIRAFDGHTTAYSPGTAYVATQATRLDGNRVQYYSVHVREPVRIVHAPVVTAPPGDPIDITATVNCSQTCDATLGWRQTPQLTVVANLVDYALGGPPFTTVTMTQRVVADLGDEGRILELHGRIPAAAATTAGVDYWFSVSDGSTTSFFPGTTYISGAGSLDGMRAAWQHITIADARVTASIGDLVWIDHDRNGAQSLREPGLAGVRVRLTAAGLDGRFGTLDDLPPSELTTDRNGVYNFTGLLPGRYGVTVDPSTLPPGVQPVTTPAAIWDVAAGQDVNDADFGYRHTGSASGTLFVDEDGNAALGASDSLLAGIDIDVREGGLDGQLHSADDRTFRVTTDATGAWHLDGLAAGPLALDDVDGTRPAGVAPISSPTATLIAGGVVSDFDLPYAYTGAVAGAVFVNEDDKVELSPPDSPLAGHTVHVREAGIDLALDSADDRISEAVTDADGRWRIQGLAGRTIRITLVTSTPAGLAPTGLATREVALAPGEVRDAIHFGHDHTGSAAGNAYHDLDGDGIVDVDETAVADLQIQVIETGPDNEYGTADDRRFTTTTGGDGTWSVTNLGGRNIIASVDPATIPGGLRVTSQPDDTLLVAGGAQSNLNFGLGVAPQIDTTPPPLPGDELPLGPSVVVFDGIVDGLRIEVDSPAGQLRPSDVFVRPADHLMRGAGSLMAGPALDIHIPPVPIAGARLTLPYDAQNLGGFPEDELTMHTFDEGRQLWMPVEGAVVDTATNTVTAQLEHFSVYAVMKVRSAADWMEFFGEVPLLCRPPGSDTVVHLDLAFLTDTSGSMGSSDPNKLRVDGAHQLVELMSNADKVAVVGFADAATTYIGLTPLDTAARRSDVAAAITQTGRASGGTSITAAVQRGIDILGPAGGQDRQRVAVLLSDGGSPYNTDLTRQAAEAGIVIHTVGLGNGANESLLRGIAEGTGGTYRFLSTAAELPAAYTEIAGSAVDDGTDTDGDTLTDCEERHGMFVPTRIFVPSLFNFTGGRFVTSDPDLPDTDGDDRADGDELVRRAFADDPEAAEAYRFLVDRGINHYFVLDSDPKKPDTDGDGLTDNVEVTECEPPLQAGVDCDGWPFPYGTSDPLRTDTDDDGATDFAEYFSGGSATWPDRWQYAAAGLDIPAFTLIQPHRYGTAPALFGAWLRLDDDGDGERGDIRYIAFNPETITYGTGDLCVHNCGAIDNAVIARNGADNGQGICIAGWFGTCLTEEDQERRVIREARLWLGIFDSDDYLTESFQADQAVALCAAFHSPRSDCVFNDIADEIESINDDLDDQVTPALIGAVTATGVQRTLPGGRINVPQAVVDYIALNFAARFIGGADRESASDRETVSRRCADGPALDVVGFIAARHPCDVLPIFAPGSDVREAASHKADALASNPQWVALTYQSAAEVAARGVQRSWYTTTSECDDTARSAAEDARPGVQLACDEFPYYSTTSSGPGAALRFLRADHNAQEGSWLSGFYNNGACSQKIKVERVPYLVVPMPAADDPPTKYVC